MINLLSKTGLGRSGHVRFQTFAPIWSKNCILTKWHNDSASFLLEKLKNQVILIKNLNICDQQFQKYPKKYKKRGKNRVS